MREAQPNWYLCAEVKYRLRWREGGEELRKGDREGGIGVHGQASSDMENAWSRQGKLEYEWRELGCHSQKKIVTSPTSKARSEQIKWGGQTGSKSNG